MEKLTSKEEEIMQILWDIERGLVNDVIARFPEPKPPYTTVSSVVRRLEKKEYVGYKAYGKTHEYFPIIAKKDYRRRTFKHLVQNYFDNSIESIVSFIVQEEKLNTGDIEELNKLIEQNSNLEKGEGE